MSEQEISYTYMGDESGSYVIFKPDGDIINPQRLCDYLNALEARLSKMEEAAHIAIDDIRDALQDTEYADSIRIMTALDLCQEAREALAGENDV